MSLAILGDTRVTVLSKQHLPPAPVSPVPSQQASLPDTLRVSCFAVGTDHHPPEGHLLRAHQCVSSLIPESRMEPALRATFHGWRKEGGTCAQCCELHLLSHFQSPTQCTSRDFGKEGHPLARTRNGPTAGIHVKTLPGLPASDSHAKTLKVTAPSLQEVTTQQTEGWRHHWVPSGGTVITLPEQGHRSRPSRGPGVGPRQQ